LRRLRDLLSHRGCLCHVGASPRLAYTTQFVSATVVVLELSIKECRQSRNAIDLGFLDILHATEYILTGFLEFDFVGANLFLDSEVVALGFLQLRSASVIS
jgi:hypothetical protein